MRNRCCDYFAQRLRARYADRLAGVVILPLRVAFYICYPVAYLLTWLIGQGLRFFGLQSENKNPFVTKEELGLLVRLTDRSSALGVHERRMIRRIFGFSDTRVRDAMIPLVEVVALGDHASVDELIQAIHVFPFSRTTSITSWAG